MALLNFEETCKLLTKHNITFASTLKIKNYSGIVELDNEIKKIKSKIKFPCVVKIDSRDIIHKSDIGGVIANINSVKDLKNAIKKIKKNVLMYNKKAEINGYIISEMIHGIELIIGGKRDPQFGPVIIFGTGGILVEILKDTSIRIAPITKSQAFEMIQEIKSKKLLDGFRSYKAVNKELLAELIAKVSKLMYKEPAIKELDFNPIIANEKKAIVADWRIIV